MNNIAWHFTGDTLRDGSPIPAIGETLVYKGRIELCERGYHWSPKPHQALMYAPGNLLHMVRYGGVIDMGEDKGVSSERTILATVDVEHLMRRFAADQALSVAHLWDMPHVVREYLTTLDESKRGAARAADWAAARAAAWDAARAAARAAAWDAAGAAARDAAWDAAGDAAWDAAGDAARAAALSADAAALSADAAAARDAARAAALSAALSAAWASARAAAWAEFDRRVYAVFGMENQ